MAYATVTSLVTGLGAKPVAVEAAAHDALVARLSHLPQLAASALVDVAATAGDREALLGLAAGGFRDVTRIAASHPDLWVAILRANRLAILDALEGLEGRLRGVRTDARGGPVGRAARTFLTRARGRPGWSCSPSPATRGDPITLSMLVPDRPGVLAEVTTAAGELGANIEDLSIFHSTEGGRGRLEVVIAGEEPAEELRHALDRARLPRRPRACPSRRFVDK